MAIVPRPFDADRLEDQSGTPKHVQLRESLRRYVGESCSPGGALPSERQLSEYYRVARMTVRQAIDALVAEEVLERIVGLGTFVVSI